MTDERIKNNHPDFYSFQWDFFSLHLFLIEFYLSRLQFWSIKKLHDVQDYSSTFHHPGKFSKCTG